MESKLPAIPTIIYRKEREVAILSEYSVPSLDDTESNTLHWLTAQGWSQDGMDSFKKRKMLLISESFLYATVA